MNRDTFYSLGFSDRDVDRMIDAPDTNEITSQSISTFVLGTMINVVNSTYRNTPIFNLKTLEENDFIDFNTKSASEEYLSIQLTTSKEAATTSLAVSADINAALNVGGVFGASAALHGDYSHDQASSTGEVYVSMQRGRTGSYHQINCDDFQSAYDFTPYLIGKKLTIE